jgi:large subunit ribosomal protein L33
MVESAGCQVPGQREMSSLSKSQMSGFSLTRNLSFRQFPATICASASFGFVGLAGPHNDIRGAFPMASKKGNRIVIKLRSTESGHTYTTMKNRKNDPSRLELRRYDPTVRRHVPYRETK